MILAIANSAESKFQFIIFSFASPFDHNGCDLRVLLLIPEKGKGSLHAELKPQLIRIFGRSVRVRKPLLVDHGGNDGEVGLVNQFA